MDYSGDLASIQQQLAASDDMDVRRAVVLDALTEPAGASVLEVGCGSGLLLSLIADAVGAPGRAVGIDVSDDQVDAARRHCGDRQQVELHAADVRELPFDDGAMQAVVGMQVLEYVAEVDDAIGEIARVTRSGGQFLNVATNWSALFWSGGDDRLTRQILQAWDRHCPHPNLPVDLPDRLAQHGFRRVEQRPVTIVNRRFHPSEFSWGIARLMVAFAIGIEAIDETDGDRWIASQESAGRDGSHFVSSVPILTSATYVG